MPSPIGHALAGIAVGTLIGRDTRARVALWSGQRSILVLFALLGIVPDIDLLASGSHRQATHSLLGMVFAGGAIACVAPRRPWLWGASAASYGSHLLLDWLGGDPVAPSGLMVFWPWDQSYYQSTLTWFYPVCREYWLRDCWISLTWVIGHEVMLLSPVALCGLVVARWWPRRA